MNKNLYHNCFFIFISISCLLATEKVLDPSFQFNYPSTDINASSDSVGSFNGMIYNISSDMISLAVVRRINELSEGESGAVLEMLFQHAEHIDYQIRFRWSLNDMAFWDNRCCMHRAIWDYWPEERKGRRVTIKGDRPV